MQSSRASNALDLDESQAAVKWHWLPVSHSLCCYWLSELLARFLSLTLCTEPTISESFKRWLPRSHSWLKVPMPLLRHGKKLILLWRQYLTFHLCWTSSAIFLLTHLGFGGFLGVPYNHHNSLKKLTAHLSRLTDGSMDESRSVPSQ